MQFADERGTSRIALLLRPAKLLCQYSEYFCLIRDISEGGVKVKLFHPLPSHEWATLELRNGNSYLLEVAWVEHDAVGYSFLEKVNLEELINEAGEHPKRQLRLNMEIQCSLRSGSTNIKTEILNLSQQGAAVECNMHLVVDQLVMLSIEGLPEIPAKIRWRRHGQYGLLFEEIFSLRDFAVLANTLQGTTRPCRRL